MIKSLHLKVFLTVVLCLFLITAAAFQLHTNKVYVPKIMGVTLVNAEPLGNFTLNDHNNTPFTASSLRGKWHVISYGYTHCPDICPLTLVTMTQFSNLLNENNISNVQFAFYTVDPYRDTASHIKEYLAYFNPNFLGLRNEEQQATSTFENKLGMKIHIEEKEKETNPNYSVSHGLEIFLINPDAKLQAVLQPNRHPSGFVGYSAQHAYNDFLHVKRFYEQQSIFR